jgi:RNA polymerase sigma factor (sigma-70 family)
MEVTNVEPLLAVCRAMEPLSLSPARFGRASLLRLHPDERLTALAAAGHEAAFEELVRRYRVPLLRACQRILPDDRAEDAVQQSLLSAYQALVRHGPPERFRPWLYRIAVNAAVKIASDRDAADELPSGLAGGEQPEETRELRERVRRTVGAIGALPWRQRRALVARELEGRGHEEIARELGLSGGAVRQLIHRARASVRAAASALIPQEALLRLLERAGPEASGRVAEIAAPAAGGGLGAKVAVAAVLAGGVAGGAALAPVGDDARPQRALARDRGKSNIEGPTGSAGGFSRPATSDASTDPDRGQAVRDDSGPGSGDDGPGEGGDDSGPGGGNESSSGPSPSSGSSESGSGTSSSSGSSLSGSGSDSSGSGSSGSGTDSGPSEDGSSGSG